MERYPSVKVFKANYGLQRYVYSNVVNDCSPTWKELSSTVGKSLEFFSLKRLEFTGLVNAEQWVSQELETEGAILGTNT